jgi:hypothetical protein
MRLRAVPLRTLVRQRHWKYATFCVEFDRAARDIDPVLAGSWPSRAQYQRWLSGDLKRLPYPDACRVLEGLFPGWSAQALFGIAADAVHGDGMDGRAPIPWRSQSGQETRLITTGSELRSALLDAVKDAEDCLVAVGSRSCEPNYLEEIERALCDRPDLVHYRILIGLPHSQVLKDHLTRLLKFNDGFAPGGERRVNISIMTDLTRDHERFFVASPRAAVIVLPSANSPRNFDTGLVVRDGDYPQCLVLHAKGLYGSRRLECAEALDGLEVME